MSRWILTSILGVTLTAFLLLPDLSAADTPKFSDWSSPVNLGAVVNSTFADQGPAISKDGLSLYFSSTRPTDSGDFVFDFNIWVAQRPTVESPWGAPVLVPTINTPDFTDVVPALSRDGHWLFFTSRRPTDPGDLDCLNSPNVPMFCDFNIWASFRVDTHDNFSWQAPIILGSGVNSTYEDAGANFFENDDGTPLLFFGSTRPGGSGSFDIYVSEQGADKSFGPATLVTELSSQQNDQRPAIRFDGLELFLFSNRVGTLGGDDIWVATRNTVAGLWSTLLNLGDTINSSARDAHPYIASDRETLFFASDRPGGFGDLDLYVTTRTKIEGP